MRLFRSVGPLRSCEHVASSLDTSTSNVDHITYSPPTLTGEDHQRTVSNQWLSLAKTLLKVAIFGRNRSLVARTNKCGWDNSLQEITNTFSPHYELQQCILMNLPHRSYNLIDSTMTSRYGLEQGSSRTISHKMSL